MRIVLAYGIKQLSRHSAALVQEKKIHLQQFSGLRVVIGSIIFRGRISINRVDVFVVLNLNVWGYFSWYEEGCYYLLCEGGSNAEDYNYELKLWLEAKGIFS